jgi:hypothetical protein
LTSSGRNKEAAAAAAAEAAAASRAAKSGLASREKTENKTKTHGRGDMTKEEFKRLQY